MNRTHAVIALASVAAARGLDEDLAPLDTALREAGLDVRIVDWDDPAVDWAGFDAVLLRSTWDYTERLVEFLDWCAKVSAVTTLLNPLDVVCWNTDKHYLADLGNTGIAVVESFFVETGDDAAGFPDHAEFVVKPCVGAGSRDTQRYLRAEREAAIAHVRRLIDAGRAVLVQPYLSGVDADGETALLFFAKARCCAVAKARRRSCSRPNTSPPGFRRMPNTPWPDACWRQCRSARWPMPASTCCPRPMARACWNWN